MNRKVNLKVAAVVAAVSGVVATQAIVLGQIDDFQNGTLNNWRGGFPGPEVVPDDGPQGVADQYMRQMADAISPPHLAVTNDVQWAGDYITEGVNVLQVHLRNEGKTELEIRATLTSSTTNRWTSTKAFMLPPDGRWYKANFPLRESDLTRTAGTQSYATFMSFVPTLLFRHDSGTPSHQPEPVVGTMGLDNITAANRADLEPVVLTKIRGIETGGLYELLFSDDQRMIWKPGIVLSPTQAPVQFTTDFEAPFTNASAMSINIEGSASASGVWRQVELLNHHTGQYDLIQAYIPSSTTEATVTLIGSPVHHIHSTTGLVRARISYRLFTPTLLFPWQARQDRIFVRLTP